MSPPMTASRRPLQAQLLRAALAASGMAEAAAQSAAGSWDVRVLVEVESTNLEAARDPRPWTAVCADHQSRGRGRLSRRWQAPAGASVAVSAVLPADCADPSAQGWLPLLAGMAMAEAVASVPAATPAGQALQPRLKWPNDLLLEQPGPHGPQWRKVGGVLCELLPAAPGARATAVVVAGVGLNVDQAADELPVPTATSLSLCGADVVAREHLISAHLVALARLHASWAAGGAQLEGLRSAYREACRTLGQEVEVHRPNGAVETGRAVAVDDAGRLVVDGSAGRTAHAAGDVVHLRDVTLTAVPG